MQPPQAVRTWWWILTLVAGCATESSASRMAWREAAPSSETACMNGPRSATMTGFRHLSTRIAAGLGDARHRGVDLITSGDAERQVIEGALGYTAIDKATEDEDVEVYSCVDGSWRLLGATRSDGDGRFALALTGDARLPIGLHELALHLPADRSGAVFIAYVAPADTSIAVCDVDGTLTSSENAIVGDVIWHRVGGAKPGAARALQALVAHGYQPVYLTARPHAYAELTRRWLASQGLPRGPVILADGLTLPGAAALAAKDRALSQLRAAGVDLAIGIGNRATDIEAYGRAGIANERIFIEETQYAPEIRPLIERGKATGFTSYDALRQLVLARLTHR
jgi:hypothetical protein